MISKIDWIHIYIYIYMNLHLDSVLTTGYNSNSQKARILTESWVEKNLYCPVCGNPNIHHFPNNKEVADFYCPSCNEQYELKSKDGNIGRKVSDGAYNTFIQRITDSTNPDFLFMSYSREEMMVHHLSFVPKFFFVPEIAEKRKPLSENARRHGWIGCNILYDQIPLQGRIAIIRDKTVIDKEIVQENVKRAFGMKVENLESRGWMFDVLHCVNSMSSDAFSLAQIYQYENILEEKHPDNHNVRPKIRQQLQALRDRGIIEFLGNGKYRKV